MEPQAQAQAPAKSPAAQVQEKPTNVKISKKEAIAYATRRVRELYQAPAEEKDSRMRAVESSGQSAPEKQGQTQPSGPSSNLGKRRVQALPSSPKES